MDGVPIEHGGHQRHLCRRDRTRQTVSGRTGGIVMTTHAFRMQLKPGVVEEYRRRHDEIWPELAEAISAAGIYDYSIFLDEETLALFAVLKLREDNDRDALPGQPVMQR